MFVIAIREGRRLGVHFTNPVAQSDIALALSTFGAKDAIESLFSTPLVYN